MNQQTVSFSGDRRLVFRGEAALLIVLVINTLGVVLMLQSGAGISAISSVPYAFSRVFPRFTLGTWTYTFQTLLILSLMVLRKKFVPEYLFSFVVGFVFGIVLDLHNSWVPLLPITPFLRVVYYVISYCLIAVGIALSNRCGLPIIPTDLFPRELSQIIKVPYPRIKISFDVICLAVTGCMTLLILGRIDGLGIGTILAACTTGKAIGIVGNWMDRHFRFVSVLTEKREKVNRMA